MHRVWIADDAVRAAGNHVSWRIDVIARKAGITRLEVAVRDEVLRWGARTTYDQQKEQRESEHSQSIIGLSVKSIRIGSLILRLVPIRANSLTR